MNDAHPAFTRQCDGKARLSGRIHDSGEDWDVKVNGRRKLDFDIRFIG